MKLTIQPIQSDSTGYRYVVCRAVINKSVKLGIPRRMQKTWKVRTVAPNFAVEEMKSSFEANAKRWEEKVLRKIRDDQRERALETQRVASLPNTAAPSPNHSHSEPALM